METSDLDKPRDLPTLKVMLEIKVDTFAERDPTQEELDALGRELARLWTGTMTTKKALVYYTGTLTH